MRHRKIYFSNAKIWRQYDNTYSDYVMLEPIVNYTRWLAAMGLHETFEILGGKIRSDV